MYTHTHTGPQTEQVNLLQAAGLMCLH